MNEQAAVKQDEYSDWIPVAQADAVPEEDVLRVRVEGRDIALYRVDDEILATDNVCTHGNALLSDGWLEGYEIECPLHQGRFDIRTGSPVHPPVCVALRTYPVRVESGQVYLNLAT